MFDGHGCHLLYRTLKLIQKNGIVVVGLPEHTSNVLQPLDTDVFDPIKEHFKRRFSVRSVSSTASSMRNDMFTLGELLTKAYHASVTPQNIIVGFRRFTV